jgi:hypothetical protein
MPSSAKEGKAVAGTIISPVAQPPVSGGNRLGLCHGSAEQYDFGSGL